MKLYFPHEAVRKVCPFREPQRFANGTSESYAYCVAADCMAWAEKSEVVFSGDGSNVGLAHKGYCGAVRHGV